MKYFFSFTTALMLGIAAVSAQEIRALQLDLTGTNPQWRGLIISGSGVRLEVDAAGNLVDATVADDPLVNDGPQPAREIVFTYYDRFEGEFVGRLKSVGPYVIKYYDRFDMDEKRGKVKSVGRIDFDYFDRFNSTEQRGKMKSAGPLTIQYYDRFDDEYARGKLKSIGSMTISYYGRFDRSDLAGRIKSVNGRNPGIRIFK